MMSFFAQRTPGRFEKMNARARIPKVVQAMFLTSSLIGFLACSPPEDASRGGRAMQVKSGFAEVNGTRLYYEVAGSGDPIVLIHGNFGDRRYWDNQFEAFSKGYKVLRYDVRGFGKSADPVAGEPWMPTEDIRALLAYFGMSKAHIVGFSMGCGQAVDFVLSHPEMCHSLIAVGPWVAGYKMPEEDGIAMGKVGSVLEEGGPGAAAEYITNMPFFNAHRVSSEVKERLKEVAYA